MKKLIVLLILVSLSVTLVAKKNDTENEYKSPNIGNILSNPELTYFGWDFRFMLFSDSNFQDPRDIIYKIAPGWVFYFEKKGYGESRIRKNFKDKQFTYDNRTIQSLIRNVNEAELNDPYKRKITIDSIKSIVNSYPVTGKGLGLIYIAEEVSKSKLTSSVYITFFDISTKEVLYTKRLEGRAGDSYGLIAYYGWGFIYATYDLNFKFASLMKSIRKQQ